MQLTLNSFIPTIMARNQLSRLSAHTTEGRSCFIVIIMYQAIDFKLQSGILELCN